MTADGTWLVHAQAECVTCGATFDARNAQGLAAQHARRYGHHVTGELGYAFSFGGSQ